MKVYLSLLATMAISLNLYADGQSGMGSFFLISYLLSIGIFTLLGGVALSIILQIFNSRFKNRTRSLFLIAFAVSVLAAIIFEEDFLFLF